MAAVSPAARANTTPGVTAGQAAVGLMPVPDTVRGGMLGDAGLRSPGGELEALCTSVDAGSGR